MTPLSNLSVTFRVVVTGVSSVIVLVVVRLPPLEDVKDVPEINDAMSSSVLSMIT